MSNGQHHSAAAEDRRDGDRDAEQEAEDEQRRSCLADVVSLVAGHLLHHEAGADDVTLVVLDPAALHVGPLFALARLYQQPPASRCCRSPSVSPPAPSRDPTQRQISLPLRNGNLKTLHRLALMSVHRIRLLRSLPLELIIGRQRIAIGRLRCAHNV